MSPNQDRLIEIARRKERLIARAGAQRAAIGETIRQLRRPIGVLDHGLEVVRFLQAHPLLVASGVALLAVFRRRRLVSLTGSLLTAWRLWPVVSAWLARVRG